MTDRGVEYGGGKDTKRQGKAAHWLIVCLIADVGERSTIRVGAATTRAQLERGFQIASTNGWGSRRHFGRGLASQLRQLREPLSDRSPKSQRREPTQGKQESRWLR